MWGMPEKGIPHSRGSWLEREPQSELDEPRVADGGGYHAERGATVGSIRCRERWAVKNVKEFRAEFQVEFFFRPEVGPLKEREVPVVKALLS